MFADIYLTLRRIRIIILNICIIINANVQFGVAYYGDVKDI